MASGKNNPFTIATLLELGVLKPGEVWRLSRRGKPDVEGKVTNDGQLKVGRDTHRSPSAAATAVTGNETNGWRAWQFEGTDGAWRPIDELRLEAQKRR